MQSQYLQQLDTIQQYIITLFDNIPKININILNIHNDLDIIKIIQQNILYGKKIIQLSDKFTLKYRQNHFVDRKDLQLQIQHIFKILCPKSVANHLGQMVQLILKTVQNNYTCIPANNNKYYCQQKQNNYNPDSQFNSLSQSHNICQKQSAYVVYPDHFDQQYEQSQTKKVRNNQLSKQKNNKIQNQVNIEIPQIKRKKSTTKSKIPKKPTSKDQDSNFTTKNVLQLKQYFQQQQIQTLKLFTQLNKILNQSQSLSFITPIKLSQQKKQLTKCKNAIQKNNFLDFIYVHIQNNKYNLNKLSSILSILQQYFYHIKKYQHIVNHQFSSILDQINNKQQIFSFNLSKILQHISTLKQSLQINKQLTIPQQKYLYNQKFSTHNTNPNNQHQPSNNLLTIVQNLQQITQGFYQLYPSASVIKQIKMQNIQTTQIEDNQLEMERRGFRNEGVQVSLLRNQSQKPPTKQFQTNKRTALQIYKIQTKITQNIQKFQRSIKYKKILQTKQVQKFIQIIRQNLPKKNTTNIPQNIQTQIQAYKQQYKKLMENNQKNQKQIIQQYTKKIKKYQKYIQNLQQSMEQLIQQHQKQHEKIQTSNRKLSKKLDNQKQQSKRVSTFKNTLQKNIKQMTQQIAKLQRQQKCQHQKFEATQKILINQRKAIQKQLQDMKQQNKALKTKSSQQANKTNQQRQIYQQKIIFLQSQQQQKIQQIQQIKIQLSQMIKQNNKLKKQLQQLTSIYQNKIKQLDQLIDNIKIIQIQLKQKNQIIDTITKNHKILQDQYLQIQKQKNQQNLSNQQLLQKLKFKQIQTQKFRQLGVLNDSDIDILKQQMEKVKQAYIQSQQQLQQLKTYTTKLQSDKQLLLRQNKYLKRDSQSSHQKFQQNILMKQKLQKQLRQSQNQLHLKNKQILQINLQYQQIKKQFGKVKKQAGQGRQTNIKLEAQLRNVRQQLQKKTENQSLESGKRKLELEGAKVELRRKTEQIVKMKELYQEKMEVLQQKNKQLSQFITQKQLLAKITNSHLTS